MNLIKVCRSHNYCLLLHRWVLLVRDSYGIYAELQVTALVENHSPW